MTLPSVIVRFSQNSKGSVTVLFAVSLLILTGIVGLSIDYGGWVTKRAHLSSAADASSLAGVTELANTIIERDDANVIDRAKSTALKYIYENGSQNANSSIQISSLSPVEVTVSLTEKGKMYFSKLMRSEEPTIGVISTAAAIRAADACVVALNPKASPGIEYNLSGEVVANGCSIWSNSEASNALLAKGSGSVSADTNCAVGKVDASGSLNVSPKARSNCFAVKDPFFDWVPPETPVTCAATNLVLDKPGDYTLSAGRYCGGLTIKGKANVTFEAGTYFIDGGSFAIEGGGAVYGNDVSFVLTGGAAVDFGGASVVDLAAPETGEMAEMIFAAGRDQPAHTSILRGNNVFDLEGHIYLPSHHLVYSGGPSGSSPSAYTSVIASTIKFNGSSQVNFRSPGSASDRAMRAFTHVHLTR